MKKVLSLILLATMLTSMFALAVQASADEGTSLKLVAKESSYNVGDSFDLELHLNTAAVESDHVEVVMLYDPTVLSVVDADSEELGVQIIAGELYETVISNVVDTDEGIIDFSMLSLDPENYYTSSTDELLATLTFEALASGTTEVEILYSGEDQDLEDSNVYNAETNEDTLMAVESVSITVMDPAGEEELVAESTESEEASVEVEEAAVLPAVDALMLTSNKSSVVADGMEEVTLTVTMLDQNSLVMQDELVDLSLSGVGSLDETVLTTNADGQASTIYRAGIEAGEVSVIATSRTDTTVNNSLVLNLEEMPVEDEVVVDEPTEVGEEVMPVPGESPVEAGGPSEAENAPEDISGVGPADLALLSALAALLLGGVYYKVKELRC